jgi:hypothetical protein
MGADMRGRRPLDEEPEATGFVADPPPHGPEWVAVVGWRAVLPALAEGQVDVEDGGTMQLQL